MATYGPYSPASWDVPAMCSCDASQARSNAYGGGIYIEEWSNQCMASLRFVVALDAGVTINSATLVLTRRPSDWGDNDAASGTLGMRCEAAANTATFVNSNTTTNPYNRTYRPAQVNYDFTFNATTATIDVTSLIADLVATYGAENLGGVTISVGGYIKGWVATRVSWRSIVGVQSGGTLPTLTIDASGGSSNISVAADAAAATGTGQSAGIVATKLTSASAGAATGAGQAASLRKPALVAATQGSATGAGQSASTLATKIDIATVGAATGSGQVGSTLASKLVGASAASATGAGQIASLVWSDAPPLIASDTAGNATSTDVTAFNADIGSPANGERVVLAVFKEGSAAATPPSGWNVIDDTSYTNCRAMLLYRDCIGDEGATVQFTTSQAATFSAKSWRVAAGTFRAGQPPQFAINAQTSGNNDPAALTPTWTHRNDLWLAWCGVVGDVTFTGYPSGYNGTGYVVAQEVSLPSRVGCGWGNKTAHLTTEDPSAFAHTSSRSIAYTIAVAPLNTGVSYAVYAVLGEALGAGADAGLRATSILPAGVGTATGAGQAASSLASHLVTATGGASTGAGQTAGTYYGRTVIADLAGATGAGASATTLVTSLLSATAGASTGVGQDAAVTLGTAAGISVTAALGSATGAGQVAVVLATTITACTAGAATGAGQVASTLVAAVTAATAGACSGVGQDAAVLSSGAGAKVVTADPATATGVGQNTSLLVRRITASDPGAASGAGQVAIPAYGRVCTASGGAATGAGQSVTLLVKSLLPADAGAAAGVGMSASLFESYLVGAQLGASSGAGQDATISLAHNSGVSADAGASFGTGSDVALRAIRLLPADQASAVGEGQSALFASGSTVIADSGSASSAWSDADIWLLRSIVATPGTATGIGQIAFITPSHVPIISDWCVEGSARNYVGIVATVELMSIISGSLRVC